MSAVFAAKIGFQDRA